jgi:serine protease inhibitor
VPTILCENENILMSKNRFDYTKNMINDLREKMKINDTILDLIYDKKRGIDKSLKKIKTFNKVKDLIIESSIKINGQLLLFNAMFYAVIEEIKIHNSMAMMRDVII